MNVRVAVRELATALRNIKKVQGKPEVQSLGMTELTQTFRGVCLCGTNLKTGIRISFNAEFVTSQHRDSIYVDTKTFIRVLKGYKAGTDVMIFYVDGETSAKLKFSDGTERSLPIVDNGMDDMPTIPQVDASRDDYMVTCMPLSILVDLLHGTERAISRDPARYILTGVLIDLSTSMITATSTNGHIMAHIERKGTGVSNNKGTSGYIGGSMVIPHSTVTSILKFATKTYMKKNPGVQVLIAVDGEHCSIVCDGPTVVRWVSVLMDGTYPDYKHALPKSYEFNSKITIDAGTLADVAKTAQDSCDKEYMGVTIKCEPGHDCVHVATMNPENCQQFEQNVPASIESERPVFLCINPIYLRDAANILGGVVTTSCILPEPDGDPVMRPILCSSDEHPDDFVLVMPIRI